MRSAGESHHVARGALARGDHVGAADEHVDALAPADRMFSATLERDEQPLDPGRPADRGDVEAEARQQTVVAAAAAQRKADFGDIALEDEPGIILEIAQQRKVDLNAR